jgi:hypothetical protein
VRFYIRVIRLIRGNKNGFEKEGVLASGDSPISGEIGYGGAEAGGEKGNQSTCAFGMGFKAVPRLRWRGGMGAGTGLETRSTISIPWIGPGFA